MIQAIRTGGFFIHGSAPHGARTKRRTAREGGKAWKTLPRSRKRSSRSRNRARPRRRATKALYEEAVKESRKWEKRSKESGIPDIRRVGCN